MENAKMLTEVEKWEALTKCHSEQDGIFFLRSQNHRNFLQAFMQVKGAEA